MGSLCLPRGALCCVAQQEKPMVPRAMLAVCTLSLCHTSQRLASSQGPSDWYFGACVSLPSTARLLLYAWVFGRLLISSTRWLCSPSGLRKPPSPHPTLLHVSIFLCPGARLSSILAPGQPWPENCQLILVMTFPMINKYLTHSSQPLAELKSPVLKN